MPAESSPELAPKPPAPAHAPVALPAAAPVLPVFFEGFAGGALLTDALTTDRVLALQRTAGNRSVTRMLRPGDSLLARAPAGTMPVASDDAQMDADVGFIAAKLSQQVLSAEGEQAIVDRVRKWAEADATGAQHGHAAAGGKSKLDRFVLKLKIRNVTRATARSAFMDTTVNVFDTLFTELEDDRLVQFQALLAHSASFAGAKPESGPSENAWATVGRQELIGMFGTMKGLSTGLASLGDVALWAMVKQMNAMLEPLGAPVKEPVKLAEWIGKQLDISGDAIFEGEFTGGDELFLGQNAASVGTAGGSIIWNLVTLGKGGGTGGLAGGMKAIDLMGKFKAVDDSLTSMGDYLIRIKEKGKLTREFLLEDDEFKIECFKLGGAVVGAVSGALGATGDTAKVMQQILGKVAAVFKVGEVGSKLGELSQILMDDQLDAKTKRAGAGKLVMELVSDAFGFVGDKAAAADQRAAEAAKVAGGEHHAGGTQQAAGEHPAGAGGGGGDDATGGASGGGGGGREELFGPPSDNLGGDTVLEPHPGGHGEAAFIPVDADMPDRGTGNPDDLFDTSGRPFPEVLPPIPPDAKRRRELDMNDGRSARPNEQLDPSRTEGRTSQQPLPEGTSVRKWSDQGRDERLPTLESYIADPNQPAHVRGWLRNEQRRLAAGNGDPPYIRNPPGYVQGHLPGKRASEGYDYSNSTLVTGDINALEVSAHPKWRKQIDARKSSGKAKP